MERAQNNVKSEPLQSLSEALAKSESQLIKFDWEKRWLRGEEYYHILKNADLYLKAFKLKKYPVKTHPSTTYSNPIGILHIERL